MSEKSYWLFQPSDPNFLLSKTIVWKNTRLINIFLQIGAFLFDSIVDQSNWLKFLFNKDFTPCEVSKVILIPFYKTLEGNFLIGKVVNQSLNSLCIFFYSFKIIHQKILLFFPILAWKKRLNGNFINKSISLVPRHL